jgi:hypothetical protein
MRDMKGFTFNVGCKVARAVMWGKSPMLSICEVTRIESEKLYLDNSKQPIKFPDRLLIIEQDPLYRMVKEYEDKKNN